MVDIVRRRGWAERVTVQSFDTRSVRAVAALDPSIALAVLEKEPTLNVDDMRRWGATTWSPHYAFLDADLIDRAHLAGLAVIPWTVNLPEHIGAPIDLGVDGLISDRPDVVISTR